MTTRIELLQDVDAWLARDDLSTDVDAPTMLRMAQAMIDRELRLFSQETTTTLACSSRSTSLPADFLSMISVSVQSSNDRQIDYLTPERLRDSLIWQNQGGGSLRIDDSDIAYTLEGQSIVIAPEPSVSDPVTLDIVYFARFATLTADSDTNWLLTNNYDIYLYALLMQAAIFIDDAELLARYGGLYENARQSLVDAERRARIPSAGGLFSTGSPRAVV